MHSINNALLYNIIIKLQFAPSIWNYVLAITIIVKFLVTNYNKCMIIISY